MVGNSIAGQYSFCRILSEALGDLITCCCFPIDGEEKPGIWTDRSVAISTKSENPDLAWQFVRELLLESAYEDNKAGIPVIKELAREYESLTERLRARHAKRDGGDL